jgi:hypothetical protein
VSEPDPRPPLFVIRGDASDEEVAALAAVLRAVSTAEPGVPGQHAPRRSAWSAPTRVLHGPLRHGPGGWRSSALPH